MSRGLGVVQRRVLEQLKLNTADPAEDRLNGPVAFPSWTTVLDLAGAGATRAQIESTRRAVVKLAALGMVETRHVFGRGRERPYRNPNSFRGTTSPWLLAARLSVDGVPTSGGSQRLTPEDAAAYVTGREPVSPLSVENTNFSAHSQHLGGGGGNRNCSSAPQHIDDESGVS